jgi:hypothetical protein
MQPATRSNPPAQTDRSTGSRQIVARYDDDYPLLFGEPAPQPQWDATDILSQAQQAQQAGEVDRSAGRSSAR